MFNFFNLFQSTNKSNKGGAHIAIKGKMDKKINRKVKGEVDDGLNEEKQSFSKTLLIQESLLIWIHTLSMLVLAYICVFKGAYTELPWLTAMVSLPWAAYAVSQHAYYKKSSLENTKGGIVYETAMQPYSELEDCR